MSSFGEKARSAIKQQNTYCLSIINSMFDTLSMELHNSKSETHNRLMKQFQEEKKVAKVDVSDVLLDEASRLIKDCHTYADNRFYPVSENMLTRHKIDNASLRIRQDKHVEFQVEVKERL
jgi:hypothetical protein